MAKANSGKIKALRPRGEVHRLIEGAILAGEFAAGRDFPSERELAKRYGVSRTTICRTLDKLVERGFLTTQPRRGYTVSAIGGGQPAERHQIALVWHRVQGLASDVGHTMLETLEQAVSGAGHVLMMGSSRGETAQEDALLLRLQASGMGALIIAPAWRGDRSRELERWIGAGKPVVLHGNPGFWRLPAASWQRCDMVDADNAGGIRQLLELLARHGHRSAGFCTREALEGSERYEAFRALAPQFGIATHSRWQLQLRENSRGATCEALAQMTGTGALPTAMLCSHDDVALFLVEALQARGLRCPQDLSVAGFGNESASGPAALAQLTTVDIQKEKQVGVMMRLLTRQFAGVRDTPEHVRVPVVLVERASTGVPPAR